MVKVVFGINSQRRRVPTTVSEWVINITKNLRLDGDAGILSKHCIYRVPRYLREGDDRGYLPRIVSLGPYHHNKRRLRNMDLHKRHVFSQILKRTDVHINEYFHAVKTLEKRARACYEGDISLSSEEFVKMMVFDGCFILELFQWIAEGFQNLRYSESDPIFSLQGSMQSIQQDMIMLENQIPLFVLDQLFELQSGQPEPKGAVSKLALRFFHSLRPTDEPSSKEMEHTTTSDPQPGEEGLHCLDVFRRSLLGIEPQPQPTPDPQPDVGGPHCLDGFRRFWRSLLRSERRSTPKNINKRIHCVTKLRECGINFKTWKADRFWDIKFTDGVLRIPRLLIHDGTKTLFLNLIAFEQCHLESTNHITSYVIFMDNLINTAEDVSILHHCGIIEHWLGSEAEVAQLFNRIWQEAVFGRSNNYLSPVSDQINQYCEIRWNTWRATLHHKYFNSPWTVISIIAAVVLLLLTFTQTFYGVLAYYRPPS